MKFKIGDKVYCSKYGKDVWEIVYVDNKSKTLPYRITSATGNTNWWVKEDTLVKAAPERVLVTPEKLRPLDIIYTFDPAMGESAFILIKSIPGINRGRVVWKAIRLHSTSSEVRGSSRNMDEALLAQYFLADNMGDIADLLMCKEENT